MACRTRSTLQTDATSLLPNLRPGGAAGGLHTPATTGSHHGLLTPGGAAVPPLPPGFLHSAGLRCPGYDDYVLDQLRREEFFAPRADDSKGFINYIYTKNLTPKP